MLLNEIFYPNDVILNFKQFLNSYYKTSDNNLPILLKLHGIDNQVFTLEQIGILLGKTKQRIAQKKDKELANLLLLLEGNIINRTDFYCNKNFVHQLFHFKNLFYDSNIISFNSLNSLIKNNFNLISLDDINYLDLLFDIFGYDSISFLNEHVYFKKITYYVRDLKNLVKKIFSILEKSIFPLDIDTIIVRARPRNSSISNMDILDILKSFSVFEKITKSDKIEYQLRIDKLSSAGDMGIRVLHEKGCSMHFNDILGIINQKLIYFNSKRNFSAEAIKADFMKNGKVKAIGKSGSWTLKEWGTNTATIFDLICEAFRAINEPLSYDDIYKYIIIKRNDINFDKIKNNLSAYKKHFTRTIDKKWILSEWESRYKYLLPSSKKNQNAREEIISLANKISFQNIDIKPSKLVNLIKREGYSQSTVYKALKDHKTSELNRSLDKSDPIIIEKFIKENIESRTLEFKSSLQYCYKTQRQNKELHFEIIKTIQAFLNTEGGKLFIGIADDKTILGLENDLKYVQRNNLDGFQNLLNDLITTNFDAQNHKFIEILFHLIEGKNICLIEVTKSPEPAYLNKSDDFYIRGNGISKKLNKKETVSYIRNHWNC